jgi:hypothetical protein
VGTEYEGLLNWRTCVAEVVEELIINTVVEVEEEEEVEVEEEE